MEQKENGIVNEENTGNSDASAGTEMEDQVHEKENEQENLADGGDQPDNSEQKIAELNDRLLRLTAEFDNYRKRTNKERLELIKTAGEEILKSMLPVVDDFERAMKANESATDVKAINEGVQLIYHKMQTIFNQKGLEAMACIGKDFDSDTMEAITKIPHPELKGKVVDEIEKGYLLGGKVIRFAKVIVGE